MGSAMSVSGWGSWGFDWFDWLDGEFRGASGRRGNSVREVGKGKKVGVSFGATSWRRISSLTHDRLGDFSGI